jgi:methionine-rich copper-binding protein CopC
MMVFPMVGSGGGVRKLVVGAFSALLIVGGATAAWGHGDYSSSDPPEGERVKKVPGRVSLTLTEPPGAGSTLKVVDGCRRNVAQTVSRSGSDLEARVANGEPGHWMMKYRAVSSVDGHLTRGAVHFSVAGKRDCSREPSDPSPDDQIDGGADTRVANEDPPDEGGFPIVGLAIGTVVLVGLALMIRRSTA